MDPYATLGVAPDAAVADIKSAWRKIALRCHPDRVEAAGVGPAEASRRAARFKAARAAWETLKDPDRRAAHDAERAADAEAARRRQEAREAARRQWEAQEAQKRRQAAERAARRAVDAAAHAEAVEAAEKRAAASHQELAAWMRRAERRERAHQRIEQIEQVRRRNVRRRLIAQARATARDGARRVREAIVLLLPDDV